MKKSKKGRKKSNASRKRKRLGISKNQRQKEDQANRVKGATRRVGCLVTRREELQLLVMGEGRAALRKTGKKAGLTEIEMGNLKSVPNFDLIEMILRRER